MTFPIDRRGEEMEKMRKATYQVVVFFGIFLALYAVFLVVLLVLLKIKIEISFGLSLFLAFLTTIILRTNWKRF